MNKRQRHIRRTPHPDARVEMRHAGRDVTRFVLLVGLVLGGLFVITTRIPFMGDDVVPCYMALVARSAHALLSITGTNPAILGQIISADGFAVAIVPACGGLEVMATYAAAVLAYPSPWRRKSSGLVLGLGLIYAVNVLRIAVLFVIGLRFQSVFAQAHFYHAQAVLLLCAAGLFALWALRLPHYGHESTNPLSR